ncbi:MAG: CHC2 zinc finger domain-containing protein [Actinomycetota bacterium]
MRAATSSPWTHPWSGFRLQGWSPTEIARDRLGSPAEVLARHGVAVRNRMACCPFHPDRTPSLSTFSGSDGHARWKCFGCDAGGDAIDLEARLTGLEVKEVIRRYGR